MSGGEEGGAVLRPPAAGRLLEGVAVGELPGSPPVATEAAEDQLPIQSPAAAAVVVLAGNGSPEKEEAGDSGAGAGGGIYQLTALAGDGRSLFERGRPRLGDRGLHSLSLSLSAFLSLGLSLSL